MSSLRMLRRFYALLRIAGPAVCVVALVVATWAVAIRAQAPPPAGPTAESLARPDAFTARPRILVMTDIANEPDDQMSLVRFLLYSNQFDVEGLVASTSTWMKARVRPDVINTVLDAYAQVQPNLLKHAQGFPTTAALRQVVVPGQPGYGMAAVGSEKSTPGSELILRAAARDDARPLWVLAWGGANTLAQALVTARASMPAERFDTLVSRLRVYAISDQDDAGPWLRREFPALRYIASPSTQDGEQYLLRHLDRHQRRPFLPQRAWRGLHHLHRRLGERERPREGPTRQAVSVPVLHP